MRTIEQLGEMFLGTRLKRLSDSLYEQIDHVYQQQEIDLSARVTSLLFLLHEEPQASITELADSLGISHPAVNQMSKKLVAQGYISTAPDPNDERRRLLKLSAEGQQLVSQLQPIWHSMAQHLDDMLSSSKHNLLSAITHLEKQNQQKGLSERISTSLTQNLAEKIEIIPYSDKYKQDFKRLNTEWLEKYFYVEEIDDKVLSNPDTYILDKDGEILFAKLDQEIVGTVALMLDDQGNVELTKMAVTETYQGLKIGKKLLEAAIKRYKESGRPKLFLESNSRLKPAIALYEKFGFKHKPKLDGSHYQRADVYMEYED